MIVNTLITKAVNTPITKVRIILPAGTNGTPARTLKLEEFRQGTLHPELEGHYFKTAGALTYETMYEAANTGTISDEKVGEFLLERSLRPTLPPNIFNGNADLPGMVDDALLEVNNKLGNNAEFELLPDDQPSPNCGLSPDNITKEALEVQVELSDFLLYYGTTSENPKRRAIISRADAQAWVDSGRLGQGLDVISTAARTVNQGVFFHEPHHGLTPGMLLLDQLFRRMVKEVDDMVTTINQATQPGTEPNLESLNDFVRGLTEPDSRLGSYIHPPGDPACQSPAGSQETYHVDPPRIEVFLSEEGQIRIAALIVGAWKGGTHSSGHK